MRLIDDNYRKIDNRITAVCDEISRQKDEITLVAVSKTRKPDEIMEAWQSGIRHFGENRIQEAESKIPDFKERAIWHLVGHLQTNKIKKALKLFEIIESVDSYKLAVLLSKECSKHNRKIKILLEVNSSGESSKYGFLPGDILPAAALINRLENTELAGLMTIGPFTDDVKSIDKAFALTQNLFNKMKDKFGETINILSMGMSYDFERAVRYGSTELRIGTAIFGARNAPGNL